MTSRIAPVATAAAAVAWVGFASWSTRPGTTSGLPIRCPFEYLTGLDCPGCGSTRALGALTRLDLRAALDHNVLVPLAALFLVTAWATWTWSVWHDRTRIDLVRGRPAILGVGVVVVAFAVARNLPAAQWLASELAN